MNEFAKVGAGSMAALIIGTIIWFLVPLGLAIFWVVKKKDRFTTVLVGALVFVVFVYILEKPIQNILLFPTQMKLPDTSFSRFFNARPVLLSLILGLFPGVFEETGRLVAFKTLLKNRKNRETSVSYGLGHGGIEVMLLLGMSYFTYVTYAITINSGLFGTVVDQVKALSPEQVPQLYTLASQLAAFSFVDLALGLMERAFAVLFHLGASLIVFYACKDGKRFWLYPLAIVLHTALDAIAALYTFGILNVNAWVIEGIIAVFGCATFFLAYFLLYKKDKNKKEIPA